MLEFRVVRRKRQLRLEDGRYLVFYELRERVTPVVWGGEKG